MPTNLPPQCHEIERRYKEARDPEEKIAALEELLGAIPKHKGTDKLRADFRHRLAKLKTGAQTKKGGGRQESAYHIDKEGAGRVVLVGPTNVGKSALVAALTRATPAVSEQPFTTWTPTPGMMEVKDIQIQLMDTPALTREHVEPEMLDLVRSADLVLLVVDLQTAPEEQLQEAVDVLQEHRVAPECLRSRLPEDDRIRFMPVLVAVNKSDEESLDEDFEILRELADDEWSMLPLSAATGRNLERFKQVVVEELALMRVYAKPPGKDPDLSRPFVLTQGSTVEEFAAKVHQDFVAKLKSVRIWGTDVYDGQMVGRDHVLHDGDVVELHM